MGFGFFRGIWISLRAVNYTTQAFNDTIRGLTKLQQAQLQLKMSAARNILAVGTMYVALGAMGVMALTRIMAQSQLGERVLTHFGESVGKSMSKLGDSIAKILGPLFNMVANILELATANPIVKDLLAVVLILGLTFLLLAGIVKVVTAAITILKIQMLAKIMITWLARGHILSLAQANKILHLSLVNLATSLGAVVAGFTVGLTIVMAVYSLFGRLPAIIVGVTIAIIGLAIAIVALRAAMMDWSGVASFGAALAISGAAGAAFIATQPEMQMGTRMFTKTGMGVFHKGEVAYNPTNQLPTQINNDLRRPARATTEMDVDINIQELHTKSDFDDVEKKLRRALFDKMREKS